MAIVDTGIDYSNPYFKKNLHVSKGKVSPLNYGVDFSKGTAKTSRPLDTHGHGTHVAGIIKSIFPSVKIFVLKYYNPKASGKDNLESTLKALEHAVDQGVDIINYSGGGPRSSLKEFLILRKAKRKGILVVAAAGNETSNIDRRQDAYYPASYKLDNIISVMAHDKKIKRIPSSNWGG